MHQFILDNIGVILAIIVIAQGVILYGQSKIYEWAKITFSEILEFMISTNIINTHHQKVLEEIKKKLQ